MENKITVNTGLKGFRLLKEVYGIEERHIRGSTSFSNAPPYLGLEALAQLGAYHVRHLIDFERHVFLLKIIQCEMTTQGLLNGEYDLSGRITGQSSSAYSHLLKTERDGNVVMEGKFMFAMVDYGMDFKREILQPHYRDLFCGKRISQSKPKFMNIELDSIS